jgi:hypothetical protein
MYEVIEWDLPVGHGGAMAETMRYTILRILKDVSEQHNFHWQTLPYGARWRLRVLIEDRDLTILALTWPTIDNPYRQYLQWRRIGADRTR